MKSSIVLCLLFVIGLSFANAQEERTTKWLPQGKVFPTLYLDPGESQSYLTLAPHYKVRGQNDTSDFIPFSFGFYSMLVRWTKGERVIELGFDAAAFAQFLWYDDNGRFRRSLMNTDYKAGGVLNWRHSAKWQSRYRLFHISSHLGDDFIYLNNIRVHQPNLVNYEQLDATVYHHRRIMQYYVGIGAVVRPDSDRKRMSALGGVLFTARPEKTLNFIGGVNLKVMEQYDFQPGIKSALGIAIGTDKRKIRLVTEYYNGNLPYSMFEGRLVEWWGIGLYISPED